MAFTDFKSIRQVQETFDIKYTEADYIRYERVEPSKAFLEEFEFSQRHINVFSSEAARCENVIYPILRDVYKNYRGMVFLVESRIDFLQRGVKWDT